MPIRSRPENAPPPRHQSFLDNTRALIVIVGVLVAALVLLLWFPDRAVEMSSPLLSEVFLYAFSVIDLAILLALLFVLGRNLIKLFVEQRRAAPFAKFRTKLVAAMLAMTIVPSLLVLFSGSEVISRSVKLSFSVEAEQLHEAAQNIARRFFSERQEAMDLRARRLAGVLPFGAVVAGDSAKLEPLLKSELSTLPYGMVEVYRTAPGPGGQLDMKYIGGAWDTVRTPGDRGAASALAAAEQLAARAVASGRNESAPQDDQDNKAVLVRTAAPIRNAENGIVGAVVVSQQIGADVNDQARRVTEAYNRYNSLRVMKGPVTGVYYALFLMVTLLILVSATWMALYIAKRITRPVQMLAEGARAIGAGQFDLQLHAENTDELGSLVESFNTMAAELRTSQDRLTQSRSALEQKNVEVEERRRYIETILDRIATGVISLDSAGNISTVNGAAARLLGLDSDAIGQPAIAVFGREDLHPLLPLVEATSRLEPRGVVQEIELGRDEREVHLAAAATILIGEDGKPEGGVLVFDDVTPLIRAQRVAAWRDVARRLAHEIKNPLTPIQLSAERLRRNLAGADPPIKNLVDECTDAIIVEVEALKGLVDEFAQFARLRGPRAVPADLNRLAEDTLKLYAGVLQQGQLRLNFSPDAELPPVRIDAEQIRQVIINLVDNAMEALGGPSAPARPDGVPATIVVSTSHDARNGVVRLLVTDNGPGVPEADRDKLFVPYYSTKGRGSGLGLAIVRRIVAEHGGVIEVGDAEPYGTVFTVELPAS